MTAPRLLFVVSEDWYFWSHRRHLAQAAQAAGWRVAVAAVAGDHVAAIRDLGLEFFPLRLSRRSLNPARDALACADMVAAMVRFRPQVAHLVAVKPILYGAAMARLARVPGVVCAVAGLGYVFLNGGVKASLLRSVVRAGYKANVRGRPGVRVVVQNPDDRALLLEQGLARPEQVELVRGSGVDIQRFVPTPEPDGPCRVLTHCRMLRDKGVAEAVAAVELARARGAAVELVLAGDPDPQNPASLDREWLEAAQGRGGVTWLGRRQDIPELLAGCHVACLPSYREGLPLSLLEAAAAGRPLVASDVPGCREVVVAGVSGLLVPPRDPEALATALVLLAEDRELRLRLGQGARHLAETEFSQEVVAGRTLGIYQRLLEAT